MDRERIGMDPEPAWWPNDSGPDEATCLVGGRLIDGSGADPVEDAYVLIEHGRFSRVGPLGDWTRSMRANYRTVDIGGRTMMPGLIDCHAHLVYDGYKIFDRINLVSAEMAAIDCAMNARRVLAMGYTSIRDLGTVANAAVVVRNAIAARKIRGPRIVASGRIICTSAGPRHDIAPVEGGGFHQYVDGTNAIVKAVRHQIQQGVDNIKLFASGVEINPYVWTKHTTMSQDELSAAISEAHRAGRTVAVHAQSYDAVKFALRAGADTVEHGTRLDEESLELFMVSGAYLVPTLSTLYSVMDLGEALDLLPKQRSEMAENEGLWLASLGAALDRGVPVVAGGDIGNRYLQGMNAKEIVHLSQNGMSALDAITAATGRAAEAIKREDSVGRIEAGKLADMIVVDGNPLDDLEILLDPLRVELVVQGGEAVEGSQVRADGTGLAFQALPSTP